MSRLSDFLSEFRETATQMGAMEAAEVTEEVAEDAVEETVSDEVTEEVVEETVEEPKLYLGKFKTPEDIAEAYSQLEKQFHQRDQEVSEKRKIEQELAEIRAQIKPAAPQYDLNEVSDWFDSNPTLIPQTAQQALERGDGVLYNAAMEKWHEMAPRQAAAFERQIELAALRAELEASLSKTTAPIQQETQKRMAEAAVKAVVADFPEMNDESFAEAMKEEAQNAPWLASIIETGDPSQMEQALRSLALMARGRRSENLVAVAQKDGRQQQQASKEAKQEAAVLSASSAPSREPVNGVQAWKEEFRESTEFKKAAGLI